MISLNLIYFQMPFFIYIRGLKVQFNAKLEIFNPNLCFCRNLKKRSKKEKNESKNAMLRHRLKDVATSHLESQQQLDNVATSWQSRDIG